MDESKSLRVKKQSGLCALENKQRKRERALWKRERKARCKNGREREVETKQAITIFDVQRKKH